MLMQDVNNRGENELSVLSAQFVYRPKTALKISLIVESTYVQPKKKIENGRSYTKVKNKRKTL